MERQRSKSDMDSSYGVRSTIAMMEEAGLGGPGGTENKRLGGTGGLAGVGVFG